VINVKRGLTANVKLTTANASATASFSSNVLQPSGSSYAPSAGTNNNDILTFISFDGTNVNLVATNKFI
jgi:hypothetical protein